MFWACYMYMHQLAHYPWKCESYVWKVDYIVTFQVNLYHCQCDAISTWPDLPHPYTDCNKQPLASRPQTLPPWRYWLGTFKLSNSNYCVIVTWRAAYLCGIGVQDVWMKSIRPYCVQHCFHDILQTQNQGATMEMTSPQTASFCGNNDLQCTTEELNTACVMTCMR
jgi:hypothetical protein